jgi:hypothetical protein
MKTTLREHSEILKRHDGLFKKHGWIK